MSRPVIEVTNLSKCYRLGAIGVTTLRESLHAWYARKRGNAEGDGQGFWALRDVSFEVQAGEVVGIIGSNGAGKSTLLKILSRITEPTSGRAVLRGRVASLLEVGTGFHPDLTGRENIFLNGAILGMTRAEIRRKFDEIVAFADVQKFIDTPVKRYSSGMYVRLAFAVAAHLEPEILIVDEVLAVGDTIFQEKCMGKMKEASMSQGRTVLFVSHNIGAVQTLCKSSVLLDGGRVVFSGDTQEAVSLYLKKTRPQAVVEDLSNSTRSGTGEARITRIRFENDAGVPQTHFRMGEPMNIVVGARFNSAVENPTLGINIVTDTGIRVADCRSSHYNVKIGRTEGLIEYRMRIDPVLLYPRTYTAEPWVADAGGLADFDWVRNAASFVVTSGPNFKSGANVNTHHGIAFIPTTWSASVPAEAGRR